MCVGPLVFRRLCFLVYFMFPDSDNRKGEGSNKDRV